MTILMLSDEERVRFAAWCRQEAESNDGIAKQLEKIGAHGEVVAKAQRFEAMALATVAEKLENTESMTIGDSS